MPFLRPISTFRLPGRNWCVGPQLDTTLDGFVAAGITPSPIVLDDTPYAFVKPENRFFSPEDSSGHEHFFGHGAAPDNATEFGQFVEAMVRHLVSRYGHPLVSTWRFRLATECSNSRFGPPWAGDDGNGVVALPTVDGTLKNFSHGLDQYVATYIAAASAVKRVVPEAGFGPCNVSNFSPQPFSSGRILATRSGSPAFCLPTLPPRV